MVAPLILEDPVIRGIQEIPDLLEMVALEEVEDLEVGAAPMVLQEVVEF
jgi:hypothetical protein